MATIAVLGTLDSKGHEHAFVAEFIRGLGHGDRTRARRARRLRAPGARTRQLIDQSARKRDTDTQCRCEDVGTAEGHRCYLSPRPATHFALPISSPFRI